VTRLFVALRPPPAVRDALLDAEGEVEGARWQGDDQLHLTLRFVGELDRRGEDDIADALSLVTEPGFTLQVRGVGHFEKKGRPSALWAALAPCPALGVLHRRIERACRAAGLPAESRKFVPHVTLARIGRGAAGAGEWLAQHGNLAAPAWPVASFRLYASRLGPGGAEYTALAEWPLDPPES
jgi:2'-5' RNA ligase